MSIAPYRAQRDWAYRTGRVGLYNSVNRSVGLARNRFLGNADRARSVFRAASSARMRAGRSYTMNRRRKSKSSGQGVTVQHDARVIYQRSNMPVADKRRWKGFVKKVQAAHERDLGTQQALYNLGVSSSNNTSGRQIFTSFGLYGLGSSTSWFNDLRSVATTIETAADTTSTGLGVDPSTKLIFTSAILDMTIRNSSTNNGSPDSLARMELDIYECTMRHTGEEAGTTYETPEGVFNTNAAQTKPIGGGATTEISIDLRGATPFDFSYALSRFGIRIERKTKYTINNGDQITYQIRDPGRHTATHRELRNQDGFNKPGWTRFVILIGKLSPGLSVGAVGTPGTYQQIIDVGVTRKYVYKVENYTEDRTSYTVA